MKTIDMPFDNYSRVRLKSDSYAQDGAPEGSFGYVIEVYPNDGYEVEFSNPETGVSFAQIVAPERDLELVPDHR